ncbi:helix-turn-helix domain-containing protein [Qipengyuania sp.]|uniref:helix-turn-helix domain-containing protein n=1 Tax=Qipengyuania sp. TaxID=2004515 RepID=UPI003BA957B7
MTVQDKHHDPVDDGQAIDPDLTPYEYFKMMRIRLAEIEDETCALSTRPLLLGATNLVGERICDAASLGDAMRLSAQTYNLLHGGNYNRIERHGSRILYRIDDAEFPFAFDDGPSMRATVMEGVMIFVHTLLSLWAGRELTPHLRAVHSRRARRGTDGMLGYWSVPVRLGAPAYMLEYVGTAADLAPAARGQTLNSIDVYDRILAVLARPDGPVTTKRRDLVSRVRSKLETGMDDQSQVARALGMSVASLRRRLLESGCNFRQLRAETLDRRARRLLEAGRSPEAVADLLGFADGRSFSRAFKQWTGTTPARFAADVLSENVLHDCASASSTR